MLRLPPTIRVAVYEASRSTFHHRGCRRLDVDHGTSHCASRLAHLRQYSAAHAETTGGKSGTHDSGDYITANDGSAGGSPALSKVPSTALAEVNSSAPLTTMSRTEEAETKAIWDAFDQRVQEWEFSAQETFRKNIEGSLRKASVRLGPSAASTFRQNTRSALMNSTDLPSRYDFETDVKDGKFLAQLELARVIDSLPLPRPEQYTDAPSSLFDPEWVNITVRSRAGMQKRAVQVNTDFQTLPVHDNEWKRVGLQGRFACTLTVDIQDVCKETAVGESVNKKHAKRLAWIYILSKMHVNDSLKLLFPRLEEEAKEQPVGELEEEVSEVAFEEEDTDASSGKDSDALVGIYNYAASLGTVPEVHCERSTSTTLGFRRFQQGEGNERLVKVTIKLPEQSIEASASRRTLKAAEAAASLAFNRQVETKEALLPAGRPVDASSARLVAWPLSVDNARSFVDLYQEETGGLSIEMESEQISHIGISQVKARLTIDGEAAGAAVMMPNKKKAEQLAYLTAAVGIGQRKPEFLQQFVAAVEKAKDVGIALRPLSKIDVTLDLRTLSTMRNGLVEARRAGLPDETDDLLPERMKESSRPWQQRGVLARSQKRRLNAIQQQKLKSFEVDPRTRLIRRERRALPMDMSRTQLLDLVRGHQFSIVVGATGSGKSTQVPQILLDDMTRRFAAADCNIICTQPRRLAARSVARRVAVERDEELGQSVGYQVRFDAKPPKGNGSITYCTTGVLLERLKQEGDALFDSVSHIIIDEVHERDRFVDFLMIALKKAIASRRMAGKSTGKVVLMSATLETELFENYFATTSQDGVTSICPSLIVPGRVFPVEERFLGQVFAGLRRDHGSELRGLLDSNPKTYEYLKQETQFSKSYNAATGEKDHHQNAHLAEQPVSKAQAGTNEREEALVPVALLAATVAHICESGDDGAVLAFLPGLEEILQTQKLLQREGGFFGNDFNDTQKFKICVLHSTIPKEEQDAIFRPSPPGCRKIILSTNIAETSVTVPDVRYVVDTGKLREIRYDPSSRITRLLTVWESRSNSKQRAGRAGRVQDGLYYALFSRERYASLRSVGLPELLRTDLQDTCLSIKAQRMGSQTRSDRSSTEQHDESVGAFLAQAIEPPSKSAVDTAVKHLKTMGAFTTEDEKMTDLGRVLSKMPLLPALGKMVILGIIFRCLDPMIVLGAAAEERSIFYYPIGKKAQARKAQAKYGGHSSDQLAMYEAFKALRTAKETNDKTLFSSLTEEAFLHEGAFRSISNTARQIEQVLIEAKLIPPASQELEKLNDHRYGHASLNRNSENKALVKSLFLAGAYPNLAVKLSTPGPTYRTPREKSALMHPGSVNNDVGKGLPKNERNSLYAYRTMNKSIDGNTLFLVDSTKVNPLMVLLFGGTIEVKETGLLEKDGWMPIAIKSEQPALATKLVLEFRKSLDRMLNSAFRSLADKKASDGDDEDEGEVYYLADDPARELLASKVVEVLNQSSGQWLEFWKPP